LPEVVGDQFSSLLIATMKFGDSPIERRDDLGPDVRILGVVELLPSECACVVDRGFDVRRDAPFVNRPEVRPDECGSTGLL
jgi:hypothetical protein